MRDELVAKMQTTAAQKPRAVETKEWGTVYVRNPTVAEMEARIEKAREDGGSEKHQIARGAAFLICDAEGNRLFDPDSVADLKLLSDQPWDLLKQVTDVFDKDAAGN